ncbi:MAG: hypothetical protein AAGM27_09200 [Cyanobacteria bacterium J06554_3]
MPDRLSSNIFDTQGIMTSQRNLQLKVHKVCQSASGGSHVTIYQADVELVPAENGIQVLGQAPADDIGKCFEEARDAICAGAELVLSPKGLGAVIRINSICLHPIDFKPLQFKICTASALKALLKS